MVESCLCDDVQALRAGEYLLCKNAQVNWNDLQVVLALAREGSFFRAGAALGTTHTTVGRRFRAFERSLGVRLFERGDEGLEPTPAGLKVIESAERTEAELFELEARLLGGDRQLDGPLRVSTNELLFELHRKTFASFLARYPGIRLTVSCRDEEASLRRREADIALRLSNAPQETLVGRRVGRVDFAVYASKALAKRVGERAPWGAWPWLHWDERVGASWLDSWLAEHAKGVRVSMRVDMGTPALRDAIRAGFGVHFLACSQGDADGQLRRVGPVQRAFSRDVWLLTLKEVRTTTRVRAFLDHFEAARRLT